MVTRTTRSTRESKGVRMTDEKRHICCVSSFSPVSVFGVLSLCIAYYGGIALHFCLSHLHEENERSCLDDEGLGWLFSPLVLGFSKAFRKRGTTIGSRPTAPIGITTTFESAWR